MHIRSPSAAAPVAAAPATTAMREGAVGATIITKTMFDTLRQPGNENVAPVVCLEPAAFGDSVELSRDELDLLFFDDFFASPEEAGEFKSRVVRSAQPAVPPDPTQAHQLNVAADAAAAGPLTPRSKSALQHRREINRRNAQKTRLRKKFKLERLIIRYAVLEAENQDLKQTMLAHNLSSALCLQGVGTEHDFFSQFLGGTLTSRDTSMLTALSLGCSNFVLTDPKAKDNPIVYVSPGFLQMSGYSAQEVVGRNCRFLQCPDTDREQVEAIRSGIRALTDVAVTLLNRRKDGTTFWNQLFVAPVMDSDGLARFFVGVQREVQLQLVAPLAGLAPTCDP